MMSSSTRYAALAASFAAAAQALGGITVPSVVAANTPFEVTFTGANSDQYRVYLAAAVTGAQGTSCEFCGALYN